MQVKVLKRNYVFSKLNLDNIRRKINSFFTSLSLTAHISTQDKINKNIQNTLAVLMIDTDQAWHYDHWQLK